MGKFACKYPCPLPFHLALKLSYPWPSLNPGTPTCLNHNNQKLTYSLLRINTGLGKQLAYNELRTVVAKLVLDLDFASAPRRIDNGRREDHLLELAQDTFSTTHEGRFEVVVTKRTT